jgi:hypothetical protein
MPRTKEPSEMVKCTLRLPRAVWREAKIRAMDESRDFQDIVADALAAYLKAARPRGGK